MLVGDLSSTTGGRKKEEMERKRGRGRGRAKGGGGGRRVEENEKEEDGNVGVAISRREMRLQKHEQDLPKEEEGAHFELSDFIQATIYA